MSFAQVPDGQDSDAGTLAPAVRNVIYMCVFASVR